MSRFPRSDLALKLREQGLSRGEVAERMNTNVRNIDALVCQAKKRRKVEADREAELLRAGVLADLMGRNV